MVLWVIIGLALIKIPIAALMLWLPFRADEKMIAPESSTDESDDPGGGGGPTPGRPPSPRPRRGPHGLPPQSPPRVRAPGVQRTPVAGRAGHRVSERPAVPGPRA